MWGCDVSSSSQCGEGSRGSKLWGSRRASAEVLRWGVAGHIRVWGKEVSRLVRPDRQAEQKETKMLASHSTKGSLLSGSGMQWEELWRVFTKELPCQDVCVSSIDLATVQIVFLCGVLSQLRVSLRSWCIAGGHGSFSKDGNMLVRASNGLGPGPWGSCGTGSSEPNLPHPKEL